jgi:hypothetical protein
MALHSYLQQLLNSPHLRCQSLRRKTGKEKHDCRPQRIVDVGDALVSVRLPEETLCKTGDSVRESKGLYARIYVRV